MHRWVFFDVDGTLVLWDIPDPASPDIVGVIDPYDGHVVRLLPHKKHIEILRQVHSHGETVVVWSAAGAEWARACCVALGIDSLVSHFLQKPDSIFDDEKPHVWMPMCPRWYKP